MPYLLRDERVNASESFAKEIRIICRGFPIQRHLNELSQRLPSLYHIVAARDADAEAFEFDAHLKDDRRPSPGAKTGRRFEGRNTAQRQGRACSRHQPPQPYDIGKPYQAVHLP